MKFYNYIFISLLFISNNILSGQVITGKKFTVGVKGMIVGSSTSNIDSLDNLLDVEITGAVANQILKYDGTKWINGSSSGTGTVTSVGVVQPASGLTISGVSPITSAGTFTFALADDLLALENISTTGLAVRSGTSTWTTTSIVPGVSGGITVTNGNGISGNIIIENNGDLSNTNELQALTFQSITSSSAIIELSNGGGLLNINAGANITFANVGGALEITSSGGGGGGSGITSLNMVQPVSGFTINPTTLSAPGTFTFALNNDLLGLENLSSTGYAVRTGTNTWSNRSLIGGTGINITNGDGVSGNTTISIASNVPIGTGTSGQLVRWNSINTQNNSIIQDNGSTIGIGVAPSSYLTQWNAGDIRIGTGDATQRVVFGDDLGFGSPRVSIGEEGGIDRLTLRGSQFAILIGGSPGSNGQVLTSNGTTASWVTPSSGGGQTINWSGSSASVNLALTGGNTTTISAGANISFSSISAGGFTINSSGGGGTMALSGSLIHSISGITGSLDFDSGAGINLAFSGTSTNAVLTISATDNSNTNELQTFTTSGLIASLSGQPTSIGFSQGANITITNIGTSTNPVFQIGATYTAGAGISIVSNIISNTGDLSNSNEGILSVGAGGSNSATLSTNTSGSGTVNITAGTGISIIETTGTNGTIEISATSSGGISGTVNQIPKFITSTTIGNSIASEIFSSPGTYFRINSSTGFSNVLPLYFPLQPANGTNGEALYIGPDGTVRKNQSVILNSDGTNLFTVLTSIVILSSLPTFNSDAAASSLQPGQVYKTTTGELRIKL